MADVSYMHICDYAFQGEGAKPCIIGIFEFIHGPEVPLQHALMYVAVAVQGVPHEVFNFVIRITDPNGDEFARIDAQATLGDAGQAFIPMRLPNVVFPRIGVYRFTAVSGNRDLARTSLHVRQNPNPAAPPPQQRPN